MNSNKEEKLFEMRDQLIDWLDKLTTWKSLEGLILWREVKNNKVRLKLFTKDNCYSITAINKEDKDKSYLGCIVSTRKPRAGETWTRGRDLPDGGFNEKTWQKIKNAILGYELVKVSKYANTEKPQNNLEYQEKGIEN